MNILINVANTTCPGAGAEGPYILKELREDVTLAVKQCVRQTGVANVSGTNGQTLG